MPTPSASAEYQTPNFTDFNKAVVAQLHQDIEALFQHIELPSPLKEACQYAMMGGGKRVRPLLVASSFVSVNQQRTDYYVSG